MESLMKMLNSCTNVSVGIQFDLGTASYVINSADISLKNNRLKIGTIDNYLSIDLSDTTIDAEEDGHLIFIESNNYPTVVSLSY